ncbi:MAG TPA: FtsX-like permease family protein [Steroidobacteraceae bacterium]|jgi:putative ABC transport system permease protein|nr:FtsX-like permease family protein [Steroidobacteraceae bacterium]
MFRWIPLVWANLRRRKLRLILTFASILVAFMLFGLLEALRTSLSAGVTMAGADRLVLRNKTGLTQPLPFAYYEKIKAVPGVRAAASNSWFGAEYRTPQNPKAQFPLFATEPGPFLEVYPQLKVTPASGGQAWVRDRQGLIVGYLLARQFGWKVGDRVPIRSNIWRKTDGTDTWQFNIVGIYESGAPFLDGSAYMQFDYYNESLLFGKDMIGSVNVRVYDANQSSAIAGKLDALFANSTAETETATERDWIKHWIAQIGDLGIIVTSVTLAVFFTMLLVTANRMAQSVRERTNEIGVMKTLGFGAGLIVTLVLLESLMLTLSGGLVGLGLAKGLSVVLGVFLKENLPGFALSGSSMLTAVVLMLAFGLVSGLWPSLMAMRLKVVDALRRG